MIEMIEQFGHRQQKPALTYPTEIIGCRSDVDLRLTVIARSFRSRCSDVAGAAFPHIHSLICPIDPAGAFGTAPSPSEVP